MCGLDFAYNFKGEPVNQKIEHIYENQRDRGREGFGMAVLSKGKDGKEKLKTYRAVSELNMLIDLKMRLGHMIMFHHRQPTSTPNQIEQTHPLFVSNGSLKYDYLVVHNGIIHNDEEIKKTHEELGFQYLTEIKEPRFKNSTTFDIKFNDSEALAIELARYMEGQVERPMAHGSIAFIL